MSNTSNNTNTAAPFSDDVVNVVVTFNTPVPAFALPVVTDNPSTPDTSDGYGGTYTKGE